MVALIAECPLTSTISYLPAVGMVIENICRFPYGMGCRYNIRVNLPLRMLRLH